MLCEALRCMDCLLTRCLQNTGCGSYKVNDTAFEGNCGGLKRVWACNWSRADLNTRIDDASAAEHG